MKVDESIFRAYDIRGLYNEQISEEFAYKLGRAFATFSRGKYIVVGRDPRIGGERLKGFLMKGLVESGVNVLDIGIVPTPLVIFSIGYYKLDGGICITASHNPKQYQGFLLFNKDCIGIGSDNGLEDIKKGVILETFDRGNGMILNKEVMNEYKEFISEKIHKKKINKKVVVDCGNGSGSFFVPEILEKFGIKVERLFCKHDGRFPNREPEPKPENLKELQKKVTETKADCGFAYDGDCDRVVCVDEQGKILTPTQFFGILIKLYLEKGEGKVIHDALSSSAIDDLIKYYNGMSIGCRVGHVFVQKELLKEKALVGGEISGHYFFKELYGADDAIFATLKILEYLEKKGIKVSEAYKDIPSYYFDSLRIKVKDDEVKFDFIEKLKKELADKYKTNEMDGVKVFLDYGWALFRASNTEPKISVAMEAKTKEDFEKMKEFVNEKIKKVSD